MFVLQTNSKAVTKNIMEQVTNMEYVNGMQSSVESSNENSEQLKVGKSIKYWNEVFSFLNDDFNVVFTLRKNGKLLKLEAEALITFLISSKYIEKVNDITRLTNPQYISLQFMDAVNAIHFRNNVKEINGAEVLYCVEQKATIVKITTEGLPYRILQKRLPKLLEKFGTVSNIKPTIIVSPNGNKIMTTPLNFELLLSDNIVETEIPIFVNINTIKIYLKFKGRSRVCYRCDMPGHNVANCDTSYCSSCKGYKRSPHNCIVTYADKLKLSAGICDKMLAAIKAREIVDRDSCNEFSQEQIILPAKIAKTDVNNKTVEKSEIVKPIVQKDEQSSPQIENSLENEKQECTDSYESTSTDVCPPQANELKRPGSQEENINLENKSLNNAASTSKPTGTKKKIKTTKKNEGGAIDKIKKNKKVKTTKGYQLRSTETNIKSDKVEVESEIDSVYAESASHSDSSMSF